MTHLSHLSFSEPDFLGPTGSRDEYRRSSWKSLLTKIAKLPGQWVYRGYNDKKLANNEIELQVESSFDREWSNVWRENKGRNRWKPRTPWPLRWAHEADLLREFKRAAHHFRTDLPAKNDFLEWLSLGRHFEMPCRLVDFSYSFFVAAYFAMSGKALIETAMYWRYVMTGWSRRLKSFKKSVLTERTFLSRTITIQHTSIGSPSLKILAISTR